MPLAPRSPGYTPDFEKASQQRLDSISPINGRDYVTGVNEATGATTISEVGVLLGSANSTVTPPIHQELSSTAESHIPKFGNVPNNSAFLEPDPAQPGRQRERLASDIFSYPDIDSVPYRGREPRALKRLRRFVLSRTADRSWEKAAKYERDALTTWHMGSTALRGVGARNADTSVAIPLSRMDGAFNLDSYDVVHAGGPLREDTVVLRQRDLAPSTRKQEKIAETLSKYAIEAREARYKSMKNANSNSKFAMKESHKAEHATEKVVKIVRRESKKAYRKKKRTVKKLNKLAALNDAIGD